MNLPNFTRRRRSTEPTRFVSLEQAFQPQVKVRATRDLNGWANRDRKIKWSIPHGRIGCIDADKAREFAAKGYVEILDGTVKPVSAGELDEMLSTVTTIGLGG